ncbi:MAG: hypothetical protein OCD01_04135 [Fibrobacterales bacterium]
MPKIIVFLLVFVGMSICNEIGVKFRSINPSSDNIISVSFPDIVYKVNIGDRYSIGIVFEEDVYSSVFSENEYTAAFSSFFEFRSQNKIGFEFEHGPGIRVKYSNYNSEFKLVPAVMYLLELNYYFNEDVYVGLGGRPYHEWDIWEKNIQANLPALDLGLLYCF